MKIKYVFRSNFCYVLFGFCLWEQMGLMYFTHEDGEVMEVSLRQSRDFRIAD